LFSLPLVDVKKKETVVLEFELAVVNQAAEKGACPAGLVRSISNGPERSEAARGKLGEASALSH
jgi:hypothetical protein